MNNKFKKVTMMLALCLTVMLCFGNGISKAAAGDNKAVVEVKQVFTVLGANKAPEESFDYKITPGGSNHPAAVGGNTFTIAGNGAHTIEIPFTQEGSYTYSVEQVPDTSRKGYTYSQEKYTIEVIVNKNGANELVATPIVRNLAGDKPVEKVFACSYNAADDNRCLTADPPVRKKITGNPAKAETFEFVMKAQNPSNPMPPGSVNGEKTVTVVGAGEAEFGIWEYTTAGTYVYTVSEKNTGIADYTYDTNVYTITDTVTDDGSKLTLSRKVTDKNGKEYTGVMEFEFVNEYTGTNTTTPTTSSGGGDNGGGNNGGNNGGGKGEGKDDGGNGGGKYGPKTGDFFNNKPLMMTVFFGGAVALAAIAWIIAVKRRNKEE